jgi:hypothetical protein
VLLNVISNVFIRIIVCKTILNDWLRKYDNLSLTFQKINNLGDILSISVSTVLQ